MNQSVIDRLEQVNNEIDLLLSSEEVSEVDSLLAVWSERDGLLKQLCQDQSSLLEHQERLSNELALTNKWLGLIRAYSTKLGKDLLSSTRNQKAIRTYRR